MSVEKDSEHGEKKIIVMQCEVVTSLKTGTCKKVGSWQLAVGKRRQKTKDKRQKKEAR